MSDKQKFAFDKVNFILLAMIYAVLRKPKTQKTEE